MVWIWNLLNFTNFKTHTNLGFPHATAAHSFKKVEQRQHRPFFLRQKSLGYRCWGRIGTPIPWGGMGFKIREMFAIRKCHWKIGFIITRNMIPRQLLGCCCIQYFLLLFKFHPSMKFGKLQGCLSDTEWIEMWFQLDRVCHTIKTM